MRFKIFFLFFILISILFNINNFGLAYVPKIVIDPGHGGEDPGAISPNGLKEKDVNLDISLRLKNLLSAVGISPTLTRETDVYLTLQERSDVANNINADLFVSVHNNYASSTDSVNGYSPNGTETYYYYNNGSTGKSLANYIQNAVTERAGTYDRGIKGGKFYVLANTRMTASLVEGAFLSNTEEEKRLADSNFRQKIANGIFDGILRYSEEYTEFRLEYPLPQYFRIHVPTITSNTRIQVSTYFTSTKWVSQPILAPGDFIIRIDPDGFVRSIDSKLAFTKSSDGANAGLSIYILNPDNRNGADFTSYNWDNSSNPQGVIRWASEGYYDFDNKAVTNSSTGNAVSLTSIREVIYQEKLTMRVHLESVTPNTYLQIPFYWKKAIYRSQKPLPAGDYWIQVMPDPNAANPATAPYLLSLDGKIYFSRFNSANNPDQIFGVYIGLPNRPEVGFDVVGFVHNFRRPYSYQTILGATPTGPDAGLGFVLNTGINNPNKVSTSFPTIPTQTLTNGNYVVITDAGLIRGRVTGKSINNPLKNANVTINNVTISTDANGEFSFTHLTPGSYVLVYSAPGYTPQAQVIDVQPGSPTYPPNVVMSN